MKHIFLLHYPDKIVRFKVSNLGEQMERAIKIYGLPSTIECTTETEIVELDDFTYGTRDSVPTRSASTEG